MPSGKRLSGGTKTVGACVRQPIQAREVLSIQLHTVGHTLHPIFVIQTPAIPAIEQLACDVRSVESARFLIFELVHAAPAAAVAQRLPFAAVERGKRLFPKWCVAVHDKASLALLIDADQAGILKGKSMKSLKLALVAGALALLSSPAVAQLRTDNGHDFVDAVEKRDSEKAINLIESHPTIVDTMNDKGDTGLIVVIRAADPDWTGFLLRKGADPNAHGAHGDTPLITAAKAGFDEAAPWLLSLGAKVDDTNRSGETALIIAVQQRDLRLVKALLDAGANPDRTDTVAGYSARDYATRDPRARDILKLIDAKKPKGESAAAK